MNSADTFFIPSNSITLSKIWDDECVIYSTASGETHLLEATAAKLLLTIAESPTSYQCLLALLKNEFPSNNDSEIEQYLSSTLIQFKKMDLIEKSQELTHC